MVFVNGLKYACEACIKGHRSSSCSHTDRPLFEIKRKGRPVTQCEHCRQLRKTKQVHVKCNCEGSSEGVRKEPRGKAQRKVPTFPDFPNGLGGQSLNLSPVPQKSKVSSASNCNCKSSGHCSCATPIAKKSNRPRIRESSSDAYSAPATPPPLSSLSSCCSGKGKTSYESQPLVKSDTDIDTYPTSLITDLVQPAVASTSYNPSDIYYGSSATLPAAFSWPSGSGVGMCSCGAFCACPGCYEHSNPSTFLSSESCPYACTTCSDCNGFGFSPSTPSPNPEGLFNPNTVAPSNTLLQPSLTPALPSFASTFGPLSNYTPSPSPSGDRCGGSCKCLAQSLSCECTSECCGCCFGCSCSDSGSVGTTEDDARDRLGFAVSRERSCCTDPKVDERDGVKTLTKQADDTSGRKVGNT